MEDVNISNNDQCVVVDISDPETLDDLLADAGKIVLEIAPLIPQLMILDVYVIPVNATVSLLPLCLLFYCVPQPQNSCTI